MGSFPKRACIAQAMGAAVMTCGLAGAQIGGGLADAVNEHLGLEASSLQQLTIEGEVGGAGSASIVLGGEAVTLEWSPTSVRAEGFQVRAQQADGSWVLETPTTPKTFRGVAEGLPGAKIAGSMIGGGVYATVITPDARYWIEPLEGRVEGAGPGLHVVYTPADVLPTGKTCANDAIIFDQPPAAPPQAVQGGAPDLICTTELACDADVEYFDDYGSVAAVEDRIELIVNTVNLQYEVETSITHELTAILVRTAEPDPYTSFNNNGLLCEFITEWTENQQDVPRDVAHLFTGREISGSVIGQAADIGDICNANGCCDCGQFGTDGSYCFSQSDFNNNFGCATDLTAHELGHLWGAFHCSCPSNTMNPSITCANTFSNGTIDSITSFRDSLPCLDCETLLAFSFPNGLPEFVDPQGGTTVVVEVAAEAAQPQPGTGRFNLSIDGGPFASTLMNETSPNVYEAVFPSIECGTPVEFFFTAQTTAGDSASEPLNAPDSAFTATSGLGAVIAFEDDFETDQGWAVENFGGLTDGAWERGVPVGGGDRGDPPNDADGSGQCYLTDNVDGNSDVDGGSTRLVSPVLDASDPDAVLSYFRWYDNTFGDNPNADTFLVEFSTNGGGSWSTLEVVGPGGPEASGGWFFKQFSLADEGIPPSSNFRVRFTASDLGGGSVVEAGVDAVSIGTIICDAPPPPCPADVTGDGEINSDDLNLVLGNFGQSTDEGDTNDDGVVNSEDLNSVLAVFGESCP